MDTKTLCRSLLNVADSIPSSLPWGVVELADDQHVFLHDGREEASTMIVEGVAGQFGEIMATESIASGLKDKGSLLGCLIRVDGNADEVAGKLRAAYWMATEPGSDEETTGPF